MSRVTLTGMSGRSRLAAVLAAAAVAAVAVVVAVTTHGASDQPAAGSARPSRNLVPATSKVPAAGVCGRVTGAVLTIRIEPDTPTPRCASVGGDQWLRVVNRTDAYGQAGRTVTVAWVPGRTFTLRPGQSRDLTRRFGSYLARGVHDLDAGSGARAEIWLH